MKINDMIRAFLAALVAALNADSNDKAAVSAAQQKIAELTSQLQAAQQQGAQDAATVANLGTPLSADEIQHANDVLTSVANAPAANVPAAPPAPSSTVNQNPTDTGNAAGPSGPAAAPQTLPPGATGTPAGTQASS